MRTLTSDEYCPHCDNHYVIDAVTPKPAIKVEGEDARVDARSVAREKHHKFLDYSPFIEC